MIIKELRKLISAREVREALNNKYSLSYCVQVLNTSSKKKNQEIEQKANELILERIKKVIQEAA